MPLQWTINGPRESVLLYKIDSVDVGAVEDAKFARPATPVTQR
jgi:hypothetical protein